MALPEVMSADLPLIDLNAEWSALNIQSEYPSGFESIAVEPSPSIRAVGQEKRRPQEAGESRH